MKLNHFKLPILLLLFSFSAFAQKDSTINFRVPYISLEGGAGIPERPFQCTQGTYGNTTPGGFALLGFDINATGAYPMFHSGFDLLLNPGFNLNRFDLTTFIYQLPEGNYVNQPTSATSYTTENLLAGLQYSFRLEQKLLFDIKILAGGFRFSTPDVQYYKIGGRGDYDILKNTVVAPLVKLGIGFTYGVSYKLAALLNFDALYSVVNVNPTIKSGYASYWYYYTQSPQPSIVFVLETNLGIAYRFGK